MLYSIIILYQVKSDSNFRCSLQTNQTYSLVQNDNDEDDDDYNELFLQNGWLRKGIQPYRFISSWGHCRMFSPRQISDITSSRIWTCAHTESRFCGMKSCNRDNHYLTVTRQLGAFQWNYRLTIFSTTWLHPDVGCYSQLRNENDSSISNQVDN